MNMLLRTLLTAKAAASVAAGLAVVSGGTVAAAAVGLLPTPAQNFAHHTFGAPSADPTDSGDPSGLPSRDASNSDASDSASPSGTPVGPDATGPAAFGLCTAYLHGGLSTGSVAYGNLAVAAAAAAATASPSPSAGAGAEITAYCETVKHPGRPSGAPSHPASGRPSALPSQANTDHPGGKPSGLPTGAPVSHPVGEPSSLPVGPPSPLPTHR
jgi:hypothetical protein